MRAAMYYSPYFAQAYGEGVYGDGVYSCTTEAQASGACGTTASNGNGGGANGSLADTGLLIAIIATVACLLILAAIIIRFVRRPAAATKRKLPKEIPSIRRDPPDAPPSQP